MINLFDNYTQSSWDLHYSLIVAGFENPTIALNDDGFLPSDVQSPYSHYLGFENLDSRALYFNEIPVPDYWEIKATNDFGEIFNLGKKKANIYFAAPSHNRFVRTVEWFDDSGRVRSIDRYNKFGFKFAETIVSREGKWLKTSYYNRFKKEIISENHQTGEFILSWKDRVQLFNSKKEFVIFYLKDAGFNLDRIFYNSLSTPFLVSYNLAEQGDDILFWQEKIKDSLPWNMKLLLHDQKRRTRILVQDHETYLQMQSLLGKAEQERVGFLGYMYPFKNTYTFSHQALILTNSDHIEHLEMLLGALPELHFHIGAVTDMSNKLKDFAKYQNVSLYPNIAMSKVYQLLQDCSIYLDINYGKEILSAIRAAFENNLLIYAFTSTVHNYTYINPKNCYQAEGAETMAQAIKLTISSQEAFIDQLNQQKEAAFVESADSYQQKIGLI